MSLYEQLLNGTDSNVKVGSKGEEIVIDRKPVKSAFDYNVGFGGKGSNPSAFVGGSVGNDIGSLNVSAESLNGLLAQDLIKYKYGGSANITDRLSAFLNKEQVHGDFGVESMPNEYGLNYKGDGYNISGSGQKVPVDKRMYGGSAPDTQNQYKINFQTNF